MKRSKVLIHNEAEREIGFAVEWRKSANRPVGAPIKNQSRIPGAGGGLILVRF